MCGLYDHFELYRGRDGLLLAKSAPLGSWISVSHCYPGNLDGAAGEEVPCVRNSSNTPGVDQRKIYVLKYDGTLTLKSPWTATLAPSAGGDVAAAEPLADLDGDGKPELVASGYDPNDGGWKTRILDAGSGTDLIPPIRGHMLIGTAVMEEKGCASPRYWRQTVRR